MCQSRSLEAKEEPIMQNSTRFGVDIAKAVFQIAAEDRPGRVCPSRS